jgi:hypothetical protein
MALRSLLRSADDLKRPNAMTADWDRVTVSQVVEALRLDHAWDDLDGDLPRRKLAKKLKFANWLVRHGRMGDWREQGGQER